VGTKSCVIMNSNTISEEQRDLLHAALMRRPEVVCFRSDASDEGARLAAKAVEDGFDRIIAAGGDGTINQVVNGILQAGSRASLGVLPMGTGNDLARLLAVPMELEGAFETALSGRVESLDSFSVETGERRLYGINVAAGGFSGQVDEAMTPELKAGWGPLAYLIGAASVIPEMQDYRTMIAYDDEPPEAIEAVNVIVANGRTAGGGKRVAPAANPQDGLLDVVVVRTGSVVELGRVAAGLLAGNYLGNPLIAFRQVRRVQVTSTPGMWFNVDGELLTNGPVTFEVLHRAIRVVVGEGFRAAPEE
jgi:diacylglycerol kinase (ATP)